MCGIAGILLPEAADRRRLAPIVAMTAALRHRGPDGGGVWTDSDAGVALGHRRLAVVDLSDAGCQPMHSHGERLVTTYNGEIYNAAGLRSDLQALGCRFRGHSDTEVMLASFEAFGVAASLPRMAGMFALGLWDRAHRVLHLVRDRMGKKPLYVALADGALLFASELKAFRAVPGFDPEVDARAVAAVLRQGWVPDDQCIWKGVFKLPPGTMLSVGAGDLAAASVEELQRRIRPWWSLAEVAGSGQRAPFDLAAPDLETELDRLLRTVVRERMAADVPLGAFLSGGIDSALVAGLMQAQSARPTRTFTIGFDDAGYDEAAPAAAVARHLGTEHTEFRLTAADARATIPDLPRIWDEPFADESQIPTLLVSRLARQHVTVALTGDGGDEAFGGYARHAMSARAAPLFGLPSGLRQAAGAALQRLRPDAWDRLFRGVGLSPPGVLCGANLQRLGCVLGAADERELYRRLTAVSRLPAAPGGTAAGADTAPPLPDVAARLMFRDMAEYLPGDILVKLDRASMAVSLEARCPLLDHRVVEFAWRVPTAMKLRGGVGKWLLRRVLGRYVPPALFERPKHGFNVPVGAWLRGPLREWAGDLLAPGRLRREGLMDPSHVQARWREHDAGRRDHAGELWAILMVEAWIDAERYRRPDASLGPAWRRCMGRALRGGRSRMTSDPHFQELVDVLRRWRRFILAATASGMALAGAGALLIPPRYTAKAQIILEPQQVSRVGEPTPAPSTAAEDVLIPTQVTTLLSHDHIERVRNSLLDDPAFRAAEAARAARGLAADAAWGRTASAAWARLRASLLAWLPASWRPDSAAAASPAEPGVPSQEDFERRLKVYQEAGSHVIAASYTSRDPATAAAVANQVAQRYIEDQTEQRRAATRRELAWLGDRIPVLRTEVERAEAAVGEYQAAHGFAAVSLSIANDLQAAELTRQLAAAAGRPGCAAGPAGSFVRGLAPAGARNGPVPRLALGSPDLRGAAPAGAGCSMQAEAELATTAGQIAPEAAAGAQPVGGRCRAEDRPGGRPRRTQPGQRRGRSPARTGEPCSARRLDTSCSEAKARHGRLRDLEARRGGEGAALQQPSSSASEDVAGTAGASCAPTCTSCPPPPRRTGPAPPTRCCSWSPRMVVFLDDRRQHDGRPVRDRLDRRIRSQRDVMEALGLPCLALVPLLRRIGQDAAAPAACWRSRSAAYTEAIRSVVASLAAHRPR